ncbi:PREDICTED: LOB domain-containing protein 40 [Camelina sativa]|uniref:LOB domain-containing protein 40 n=1 Tax=Camelina sativa TaxID=90675 RepID=A0ABM0Z7T3_CAMSA|nr:PREDICTED: LOB domain-containing protein 40 [Camelina sativa]
MRMSCNGCRVLRKGCSDNCSIRPCLQWIKSAESQANATVFLAKFYGRAGLMNLLSTGPDHLRPGIFRSLLYEACGRIVNPIYGSVGLLWSGNWHLCQAAVEAVMRGSPVTPIACDAAVTSQAPPFNNNKLSDIRHVSSKDENVKRRSRGACKGERNVRSQSHESSLSHESPVSSEGTTTEEPKSWIGLELTLGLEPLARGSHVVVPMKKRKLERCGTSEDEDTCKIELGLVCSE